jgi:transposase
MLEPGPEPKVLIADKGYDSDAIREDLIARKAEPVIPMRRSRKAQNSIDGAIYALRNLIERCFNNLKRSRRLATRYDKTTESYLGFVLITSARLWCRHFVNTA